MIEKDGEFYQVVGDRLVRLEDLVRYRVKDPKKTAEREAQLRALINKGFTPRMVARLEPRIRELSNEIIDEIQELFPLNKGITVQSECPIGLIGDDIEAVSKAKSKQYGGKTIVNPSGGLISKGHPLGATGLAQCTELVWQLRGQAGPRQRPGARHRAHAPAARPRSTSRPSSTPSCR